MLFGIVHTIKDGDVETWSEKIQTNYTNWYVMEIVRSQLDEVSMLINQAGDSADHAIESIDRCLSELNKPRPE